MAPRNAVAGPYAKQAVRFLQLCSLVLLALGILNQLPIPGVGPNLLFIPSIVAGVSGVLGLSFTWHRALVVYTLSAWLALAFTVWQIANLALHDPANVIAWIMWLASAVFTVPAAFLSTTLHAVRVWRSRASLLGEQQAPLVDAAAPAGGALRVAQAAASVAPGASRPVWPPPNAPFPSGADLAAAARVAGAANSGDPTQLRAGDLAGASRTARAAAALWPPPGSAH